jgi:branched-subunit amino acid ABC-type transport system permease component
VSDFLQYAVQGIPYGCVFALIAVGLVLTYKTSGVFNLAFGAQAYVVAVVYYVLHTDQGWPIVPAFVVAVGVVGPLVGLILDWALFRHLRTAPPIARLVTSLGLLVAIPEAVRIFFDETTVQSVVGVWPTDEFGFPRLYHVLGLSVDGDQLATIIAAVVVAIGLTLLFRFTAVGLRMRAVVESPRMTELAGINADRVGAVSWMLSSFLAGLAGVLLGPLFARLGGSNYTTLIVAAIAAAAFGRLTSIPLAFLGGILLGVLQGELAGYLPPSSVFTQGLRPSLPFVVLFLLLLFWPGLRSRAEIADPLGGVDPPPPGLAALERSAALTWGTRIAGVVVGGAIFVLLMAALSDYWVLTFQSAVIYSTIFLSITVITGMAGQISLCQATFAGIGAFGAAQLATQAGIPVLIALLLGALLAAAVGALLAVPSLRLGGIFLTLATFAFALMFENVLQPLGWVSGGTTPVRIPRPELGPISFQSERSFLVLCIIVLAIVGVLVIFVRRGTTGSFLAALRGSEVASASIGISSSRARITAFALSAAIAGLGGGLLAVQNGQARPVDYQYFMGLFWVVIVVSLGARTVEGAVNAGLGFMLFPILLQQWIPGFLNLVQSWHHFGPLPVGLQFVFFGLGAITYAKHPEGVLEHQKRRSLAFFQRHLGRSTPGAPPSDAAPTPDVPPRGDVVPAGTAP